MKIYETIVEFHDETFQAQGFEPTLLIEYTTDSFTLESKIVGLFVENDTGWHRIKNPSKQLLADAEDAAASTAT